MKRIMVIGCPGSGKSVFSIKLNALLGIPLYHLDMIYWKADRTTIDKALFRERLSEIISGEEWIIDGNYGGTLEMRMAACDTVIFLDYETEICLKGIKERRGKPRPDMPWVEKDGEEDGEFIEFVKNYNSESRPKVIALLTKYSEKNIYVFKDRKEADIFLERYQN